MKKLNQVEKTLNEQLQKSKEKFNKMETLMQNKATDLEMMGRSLSKANQIFESNTDNNRRLERTLSCLSCL